MNITNDFKKIVKKIIGEEKFQENKIEDYFKVFNRKILGMRFTGKKIGMLEDPEIIILYEGGTIFELAEHNIHILVNDSDSVHVFLFSYASATSDKKVIITGSESSILTLLCKIGYATPPAGLHFP